jgi:hypothetical protein
VRHGSTVKRAYTTDLVQAYELNANAGYVVDGIEGYLVPPTEPQPSGTVKMYRGVKDGDWAFFPENLVGIMTSLGYTVYTENLGWAFPNTTGMRPSY